MGLKSSTIVRDLDICCPRDYRLSNSTASKVQIQEATAKDSHPKELKVNKARPTSSWTTKATTEPLEQARKKKKRKRYPKRRDERSRPRRVPPTKRRSNSKRRRRETETVMSVRSRVITATRKATIEIPAPSQKLASVLATSIPMTETSGKEIIRVPCIYYPV